MIWIVIALITILSLVTISLVFSSSTYGSIPGLPPELDILGAGELLIPSRDHKAEKIFQDNEEKANELVASAKHYYSILSDRKTTSEALLQAVKHYEAIRNDANSAVVELNLAILAKARIRIEQERSASPAFIQNLEAYFDNAIKRANYFLKYQVGRYDNQVETCRDKLVANKNVG